MDTLVANIAVVYSKNSSQKNIEVEFRQSHLNWTKVYFPETFDIVKLATAYCLFYVCHCEGDQRLHTSLLKERFNKGHSQAIIDSFILCQEFSKQVNHMSFEEIETILNL